VSILPSNCQRTVGAWTCATPTTLPPHCWHSSQANACQANQGYLSGSLHAHNCFNRMRLRRRCKHFRYWIEWRTTLSHASTSTMASERRYIYWSPARCALYLLRACGSAGLIDLLFSIDLIIKHFFLSFFVLGFDLQS
jgi:hypothetical protein